MKPGGSMPHSQGLSNNSYREPNQPNSSHFFKIHSDIFLQSTPRATVIKKLNLWLTAHKGATNFCN